MDKRAGIAIALCIGVFILWTQLFSPPPQPHAPAAPPATGPGATPPAPLAPSAAAPAPGTPGAPAGAAAAAPVANRPERLIEIQTPEVNFVFSSHGGTLEHAQLREMPFLDRKIRRAAR